MRSYGKNILLFDKLGFMGMFAQIKAIVLHRFFKSGRPRGVSAKNAISFLQSFFLCGYNAKEKSVKDL